jgi:hypothetical protein
MGMQPDGNHTMTDEYPRPSELIAIETIDLVRQELAQKNEKIALLEAELSTYRNDHKTWPPGSEDTGDFTNAKKCAELFERMDNLESRESERAGALVDIAEDIKTIKEALKQMQLVNPGEIQASLAQLVAAVSALPCNHCNDKPPLSLVPKAESAE